MKHKREILVHILGSRVLVVLLALSIESLTARLLPVAERGQFSAIASAILLISQLSTLGYEYGFMLLDRMPGRLQIVSAYQKVLPVSLLCSVLPWFFLKHSMQLGLPTVVITICIQWMEIVSMILLPLALQYAGARLFGRVRVVRRLVFVLILISLYLSLGRGTAHLRQCLLAYASGWALGVILLARFVFTDTGASANAETGDIHFLTLSRPGLGIFVAKFAERSQTKIGVLTLGLLGASRAAALFSIVAIAMELFIFVASSTSIAVLTRREGGRMIGKDSLIPFSLILTGLSAVAAVFVAWCAAWAVPAAFGSEYAGATSLLRLALPAMVIYSSFPLVSTNLYAAGRRKLVLLGAYGGVSVNVIVLVLCQDRDPMVAAHAATLGLIIGTMTSFAILLTSLALRGPGSPGESAK